MENCGDRKPEPSSSEPESTGVAVTESQPAVEAHLTKASSSMIPTTSWFTPKRLLVIFCLINLLNYLDRGAIASNGVNGTQGTCRKGGSCTAGTGIQGKFNLNNFEDGVLSSAFMVGLLVASPIFASLAKCVNPFRLIGVGLTVWTLATMGCGFAFSFWFITLCRMLVGVGEASFISLAAPFIDDNAPVAQKTAWLAIFYMCIPAGYALGYVFGGFIGTHFGWRYAFWVESVLMIPFVIMGFSMKPLQMKGFVPSESKKAVAPETVALKAQESSNGKADLSLKSRVEDKSSHEPSKWSKSASNIWNQISIFMKDMKALLLNKVYVINVLGYIAYNFVIGAYSYWGPKAGYYIYNMTDADMIFGGITIVCGILGALAGGFILDYMTNTISNAFKLLSLTTAIGAAFCFGAFLFRNMYGFLVLFAIGELLVFATQGPVNYICLHCVQPSLRPLSMAMSTVAIHIFGDVPSSPLVGVFQDHVNNWRTTALTLTAILFPAAGIWFIGVFLRSVDRFNEDGEAQKSNTTPLLEENNHSEDISASAPPVPHHQQC
ncbi:probable sphingolipid transporter spinster homolog 2 isoform X2 [Prosopis cineraria]|uniref:probable sphingolipid transporter spinster homolog 2 isoform X2 n=1 Tax=Prosopis cineraria TaxID=364024 RepID=UPI00240EB758|nr:probable sphingolipid transporter spinster homolog 2 isoform X2 [Prosopis cineraria]